MKLEPVESVRVEGWDIMLNSVADGVPNEYQPRAKGLYKVLHSKLTQDRLNTHKAVVELLEGMKFVCSENTAAETCNQALTDAIQKVDELFKSND